MRCVNAAVFLLLALASPALAQSPASFAKVGPPVMTASQPWEETGVFEPTVIYDKTHDLFRMWYSGSWAHCAVGYATSKDGIHWGKYSHNPVVGQGVGGVGFACRNSVTISNGTVYLYFSDIDGNLRVATSRDFKHYTVRQEPVLAPQGWAKRIENTYVWNDATGTHLFFEGVRGENYAIGSASGSPLSFGAISAPMDALSFSTHIPEWASYSGPSLTQIPGGWRLYYHGTEMGTLPTHIVSSDSVDLVHWTTPVEVLPRTEAWECEQTADPSAVTAKGQTWIWYDGDCNTANTSAIGLAVRPAVPAS